MWIRKIQEKITIDDVIKNHNYVGVGFGPIFCTHSVGVNAYFGTIRINWPIPTPNYGKGKKTIWTIKDKVTAVQ